MLLGGQGICQSASWMNRFPWTGSTQDGGISFMEKRQNTRLPVRLSGQLCLDDGCQHDTETQDIGLCGAFLDRVRLGGVGHGCVLTLFGGEEDVFSVTIDVRVVHENEFGSGVEFQSLDRRDFELLESLLEARAPAPAQIRRELKQRRFPDLKNWMLSSSG